MKKQLCSLCVVLCCLLSLKGIPVYSQQLSGRTTVYEGAQVASEGAWCWFADPRALHYENSSGTINRTYVGMIDVHGNIKAVQYDFLSGERHEVLVRSYFQPDDHNNPTFLVLPDERIMIFYSRHTDEPCFYYRISRTPGDITDLGDEKKILTKDNTTYPSPFILSDDPEHIYLCWRGINWHPTIARLSLPDEQDEVEVVWGPYQMVQSSGARPYAKYCSNGKDKIMMAYTTGHPDNESPNWLYYNCIDIRTLRLEDAAGNVLSTIADGPFRVDKREAYAERFPITVVDRTPGMRDWVWQVAAGRQGEPVMAMVKISDDKKVHDYYYVRWDGASWRSVFLGHGGGHFHQTPDIERCYSAGMAVDPSRPDEVYCSEPINGAFGRMYEIVKYTVDNTTGQVAARERVTRHSRKNNVRPYVIPSSVDSPLRLVWMYGDYYDWIVSRQRSGYPTAIHGDGVFAENEVRLDSGLIFRSKASDEAGEKTVVKVSRADRSDDFTVSAVVMLTSDSIGRTLCDGGNWQYGIIPETWKPYMEAADRQAVGCNMLATADSWADYPRGTNGVWYPAKRMTVFDWALVCKDGVLTSYINGMVDQVVRPGKVAFKRLRFDACRDIRVYNRALNPEEIRALVSLTQE